MSQVMQDVSSPCVSLCALEADVCQGCGRTLDEIRQWSQMPDAQKRSVLQRLEQLELNQTASNKV